MASTKEAVPYENATSGAIARAEIQKLLRRFGCSSVGFMDDYDKREVILAFKHRDNNVHLRASAKGWAAMYLRMKPYEPRYSRKTKAQYEAAALDQGMVAVSSILRDWVKGQVTAVECGILSFTEVFMPHMLLPDGRRLIEAVVERGLLPPPDVAA